MNFIDAEYAEAGVRAFSVHPGGVASGAPRRWRCSEPAGSAARQAGTVWQQVWCRSGAQPCSRPGVTLPGLSSDTSSCQQGARLRLPCCRAGAQNAPAHALPAGGPPRAGSRRVPVPHHVPGGLPQRPLRSSQLGPGRAGAAGRGDCSAGPLQAQARVLTVSSCWAAAADPQDRLCSKMPVGQGSGIVQLAHC